MRYLIGTVADLLCTGNPGHTANTINAVGDKQYYAFRLDESATITTLGVRQNTRTNTTSQSAYTGTVRIGIQGLSTTTGLNDGTWVGGSTNYVDVSSWTAANDGLFVTVTLPTSVTLSRGVPYCLIAECTAHPAGGGSVGIAALFSAMALNGSFPYTLDETVTTQAGKTGALSRFAWLMRSSTKSYGTPIETWATAPLTSASAPSEVGLGFTLPTGAGSAYKVDGGIFTLTSAGNSDFSYDMVLYQGTTALQTTTIDNAQIAAVGSSRRVDLPFDVSTLSTLTPGTEYILAIKGTGTTGTITVREFTVPTSGDRSAFGPWNFKYYSRSGSGSWTEDTTRLPLFGVSIDEITTAASGAYPIFGGMVIK